MQDDALKTAFTTHKLDCWAKIAELVGGGVTARQCAYRWHKRNALSATTEPEEHQQSTKWSAKEVREITFQNKCVGSCACVVVLLWLNFRLIFSGRKRESDETVGTV